MSSVTATKICPQCKELHNGKGICCSRSCAFKKKWQEPQYKQHQSISRAIGQTKRWSDPKERVIQSNTMLKVCSNPILQQQKSISLKKTMSTPEYSAKRKDISKNLWQNKEFREKTVGADKKAATPEVLEKRRQGIIKTWANNPKLRKNQSNITKALWKNPEYVKKVSQNPYACWYKGRSYGETVIKTFLIKHNILFEHSKVFPAKPHFYVADFYFPGKNIILECDGGQHLKKEAQEKDKLRDDFFKSIGINTIRINWEHKSKYLKNKDFKKKFDDALNKILIEINMIKQEVQNV